MKIFKLEPSYGSDCPKYNYYGTTIVVADNREDALELALSDLDEDFERFDREAYRNGTIEEINLEDCDERVLCQKFVGA